MDCVFSLPKLVNYWRKLLWLMYIMNFSIAIQMLVFKNKLFNALQTIGLKFYVNNLKLKLNVVWHNLVPAFMSLRITQFFVLIT